MPITEQNIFQVDSVTPVYVPAQAERPVTITHAGGATTLSYGVTTAVGDGTKTVGQSVILTAGNYILASATQIKVLVTYGDSPTYTDVTVTDDLTVTDDATITDDLAVTGLATVGETLGVTGVSSTAGGIVTGGATPTTAAKGVTFGTGSGPVTLYRSAADTLKTDDALEVAGATTSAGTLAASAAATVGTTLGVTGATTVTGGIAQATAAHGFHNWQPIAATSGTDTFFADTSLFITSIFVPVNKTLTGVGFLVGSVGGTDKVVVQLNDADGALLANSTLTGDGTTAGTAAEIQSIAFTGTYAAKGPRLYYVGISAGGGTAKLRTVPAFTSGGIYAGSTTQTRAVPATIVEPVTFTADKAPVCFLY